VLVRQRIADFGQLGLAFGGRAHAQQRGAGLFAFAVAHQPARRFGDEAGAEQEQHARIDDGEEHAAPRMIGRGQHQRAVAAGGEDGLLGVADVVVADERGQHDAEREHELEAGHAAAAQIGRQTFGEVQRHDHRDHAAARALQQAAEDQRAERLRQVDDGDAGDEHQAADDHHDAAAEPVGKHAGDDGAEDGAGQHRRDDRGQLLFGELDGLVQVGQRGVDHADVDAVQQAAEARHGQDETVISAVGKTAHLVS
jgi:hypothetical protein